MKIPKLAGEELQGNDIFARVKHSDYSFPIHWHDYYEMILYDNCDGSCIFNGIRFDIRGKCLFFLTPSDYHEIHTSEISSGRSVNVSFMENVIDKELLRSEKIKPCVVYEPSEYLSGLVEKINELFESNREAPDIILHCTHLLNAVLIELAIEGTPISAGELCIHSSIRKAMRIVLNDLSKPHSLWDIASMCGLSTSHFSYLFHKQVGVPYKRWLINNRIAHAKRLLRGSSDSIIEISLACGFGSPSHFARTFRECCAVTPEGYRKQDQNK